jgi:hypothetical protein
MLRNNIINTGVALGHPQRVAKSGSIFAFWLLELVPYTVKVVPNCKNWEPAHLRAPMLNSSCVINYYILRHRPVKCMQYVEVRRENMHIYIAF